MTTEVKNNKWGSNRTWIMVARAAAIFAVLTCVLLIANYVQLKKSDPVNMTVITTLVDRLNQNPRDSALRSEIRTLDLLSRKAYFTSKWQIRTGGYMLLAFISLMIIAWQVVEYRKKVSPVLSEKQEDESVFQRSRARKWIMAGGGSLLVLAILFAELATNDPIYKTKSLVKKVNTPVQEQQQPAVIPDESNETETNVAVQPVEDNAAAVPEETTEQKNEVATPVAESAPSKKEVTVSTDNFPNFRGVGGTGVVMKNNIPVSWDGKTGKNILWKTAIPLPGYNSPIIWGDRIFLTGSDGLNQEVYCIDKNNGKFLWTVSIGKASEKPTINEETGYAASTSVTDGIAVYSIFPTGNIAAVSMDGKIIWEKNLGLPNNYYGYASSLIMYKDKIIVQYDQSMSPKVMALSSKTGDIVWSTDRQVKVSWSSPIIVNTGRDTELLLASDPLVAGYNPENGKELWQLQCISGEVGPSLAYANGIVFSVSDYSQLSAIKLGAQPTILWSSDEYLSDIPSPVATDKYLFLATSYGSLVCYDVLTGEKYWEHDFSGNFYSSPMLVGDKVYLLDKKGIMHIFSADKEYKVIGEPALGEGSVCTPAFTDGRIYLRGLDNLYCIGK